jgi:hypothetical protein
MQQGMTYEDLVTQAEDDLVPKKVAIVPSKQQIHVGRSLAILTRTEMAWYLYLAQRRQARAKTPELASEGCVLMHKRPERNVGFEPAPMRAAFVRLNLPAPRTADLTPGDLKPVFTKINHKLREAFGSETSYRIKIVGPGDRGKRDGQYGLMNLDARLIEIR